VKTKSKKEVEVKADEVLYRKCLTKKHRQAFKSKVEPEISARSPKLKTGKGQSGQCWEIVGYNAKKGKGGPRASYQIYLEGRKLKLTVSATKCAVMLRLIQEAEMRSTNVGDIPWPFGEDDQASHLCHMSNCIRPEHIWMEAKAVNDDRNNCSGQVECTRCHTRLDACKHNPRCIWRVEATSCSRCAQQG
jgi:hypothetical protein